MWIRPVSDTHLDVYKRQVKEAKGSFHIPETCPVCGARTQIHISNSGTKTLHCTNPDCTARQGKKYTRFVSKSGMDIDGLSIQTMLRFMNEGFVHEFADIYHLGPVSYTHLDVYKRQLVKNAARWKQEGFVVDHASIEDILIYIVKRDEVR